MKDIDDYPLNKVMGDTVNYPVHSLEVSLYGVLHTQEEILKSVMKNCTEQADKLLNLLLILRGKKCVVNRKDKSEEDIKQELLNIKKTLKCDIADEEFVKMGKEFYNSYIKMTARETANIIFNMEKTDGKCKNLPDHLWAFVKCGIFPLTNNLNSGLRYSVSFNVHSTLKSFEEKVKDYDAKKEAWLQKRNESNLEKIEDYELFLMDLDSCESLGVVKGEQRLDSDKFKRFIGLWRGKFIDRNNKNLGRQAGTGIRSVMLEKYNENPKYVFKEEQKYLFGYSADVLNTIFKHKHLWLDKDIIGYKEGDKHTNKHIDLIIKHFHWKKQGVNIPTFNNYGKYVRINFGENFVKFDLSKQDNGEFKINIHSLTSNNDDKMEFVLAKCPHFSEFTTIKKVTQKERPKKKVEGEEPKENKEEKKPKKENIIQIVYTRDSKQKTYYTGTIKEPAIRWDGKKGKFYVSFPVSEHQEVGNSVDVKKLNDGKWFIKEAAFSGEKEKNVKGKGPKVFPYSNFRIMGVDLGLKNPFVATIFDAFHKDGNLKIEKEIAVIKSWKNANSEKTLDLIKVIRKRLNAIKFMMVDCAAYVTQESDIIDGKVTRRDITCSWAKDLGINVENLMNNLEKYRNIADKSKAFEMLKKDHKAWSISNELGLLKNDFNCLRSLYFKSDDKAKYCRENGKVDMSVFLKRELIKDYVSLLRSFTTLGFKPSDKKKCNMVEFCGSYNKWYRGLTRNMSYITSAIVNVARSHGVHYVFVEDLEARPSAFDDRDDNRLKSLWGFGAIRVLLANKARKHNVSVIAVDPELTSRLNFSNGKIGVLDAQTRELVVDGIRVDRDVNASKNIALRGISKGKDIRKFFLDRIGDNLYRLMAKSDGTGKLRAAAIYNLFGSREVLFERIGTEYKVVSTQLTNTQKKLVAIEDKDNKGNRKSHVVILDGKDWREYDWKTEGVKSEVFA